MENRREATLDAVPTVYLKIEYDLGLDHLYIINDAFLLKIVWNLLNNLSELWVKLALKPRKCDIRTEVITYILKF